jgi:UDP-N-acetylglucosamine--N-acetylmuramyl-(pentapeptide) pyrophosphoryl-undecaprenol N-acetylglucosamine transferase
LGATGQALATVRALRPSAVLGVGGYAAGPVSLVAAVSGVPLAVLEPNSIVGLANRFVGPLAKRAYVAWDEAAGVFRGSSVRRYGVPLRGGFGPRPEAARETAALLVLGGSQGASALNERMPGVVGRLAGRLPIKVTHQTGRGREAAVRRAYAGQNVGHVTVVPFIEDVASAIADADLVVARAGAVTLAEITAIGRAALLVPFPQSAGEHQAKNAAALARRGAAVYLAQADADTHRLTTEIHRLLTDRPTRAAMAHASRSLGRPDAAFDVAADLLALASIGLHERASPRQENGAGPVLAPGAVGRVA